MRKIDLTEIKNKLTEQNIIDLMKKLGVNKYNDEREGTIIFPTICHNLNADEASMKLYYYTDNKIFYCYTGCSEGFSVFDLLVKYYELRGIEYNWYSDIIDVITGYNDNALDNFETPRYESVREKYQEKDSQIILPNITEGILEVFNKRYPTEWLYDGINKESMDLFNILFSISQNKIIIPHYDAMSRLIGIRGRALNPWEVKSNKYMPIKIESKWYSHPLSLNLYGLNITKENIKRRKIALVFESEKAVLQYNTMYSQEENIAVACCGSNFNKMQLNILLRECAPQEIVICFDSEEEKGQYSYYHKLRALCEKYNKYCNFSFIYDTEQLLKHKESPTDRGRIVFEKLFQKRMMVK